MPSESETATSRPMADAPQDGSPVDLLIDIHASPRSMGWSDIFWVPHCWLKDGQWVHMHRGKPTVIDKAYITAWAPPGSQETDYQSE